jgi:predicted RNA binding protein YcfA (HicA-like mRNA interferase family)
MPKQAIATHDLINFIEKIGFIRLKAGSGQNAVFRHEETGLVVSLPTGAKELRPIYVRAIQKQLDNFNIVPEEKFEKMVRAANKFERLLRAAS